VGFGSLWIGDGWAETVARIDPLSGQVIATIPMSGGLGWIAAGEGAVWVLNSKEGSVSRIDPRTNQVTARIPIYIGMNHLSNEFSRPAVFSEGFIWVTSSDVAFWSISPPIITAIDPETNQPVFTMHPPDLSAVNKLAAGYQAVWLPYPKKFGASKAEWRLNLNVYKFRTDKRVEIQNQSAGP
jgi:YVTN family beta-propeller protein